MKIKKVEKAILVDWNEVYKKIDEAWLIVEANLEIVENFAEKIKEGMKKQGMMNRRYSISSIVKCLMVAKIINPVGKMEITYVCRYLKDHEEVSRRLGFWRELLKTDMFHRVHKKIDSRGLNEEFLEIVKKMNQEKAKKKERPNYKTKIHVVEPENWKRKEKKLKSEETKTETVELKIRECVWEIFNDEGERDSQKIAKIINKKFNTKIDKLTVAQWIEEEITKRGGRRCGAMKCFSMPNKTQNWGWCQTLGKQRNKSQYICKKMI